MQKKIIALAVASVMAIPLAAQATPTVYGKLHLSYGSVEKESATPKVDNWQLRSHASRFGIKGSRKISNSLEAIYKFEWQVDYEQGTDAALDRRNMYAGLKGDWGQLRFGRHDTPLKMSQGKFDQFGDTDADLKHAGKHDGENRLDNVLVYMGKTGNVGYAIAAIPAEGDGTTAGDGPADSISASISYESGPFYVALAQDSYDDTGAAANTENGLTRLTGTYKMGNMQLGLMWQTGVEKVAASTAEEDWLGVSFNTKIGGKNKFKAQYIMTEDNAATKTERSLMALGIDHKFDKKTTGYIMYSNLETDAGATTTDDSFAGVGLVMKF